MSELRQITCDGCSRDITSTGNCNDWRLTLSVEAKSSRRGPVTLMHIPRPLDRDKHFCGIRCLVAFAKTFEGAIEAQDTFRQAFALRQVGR